MPSALEDVEDVFEFNSQLADDLLALVDVDLGLFTRQFLSCATDGKAVLVEQAPDLADEYDVLALVVAAIATALEGFQAGKFLLPVAQHVWFDTTQVAHLANGEISFPRYRGEVDATYRRFQHKPLPAP